MLTRSCGQVCYAAIVECKGGRPEAPATLVDPFWWEGHGHLTGMQRRIPAGRRDAGSSRSWRDKNRSRCFRMRGSSKAASQSLRQ